MSKNNDIFKSLGIRIGEPTSLLDVRQEGQGLEHSFNQPVRKGLGVNAADALNAQLAKGMAWAPQSVDQFPMPSLSAPHKKKTDHDGSLKNTHGEDWHTDNDKQVEEMLNSSEVIDIHEACKSLTQEELFLKASRPMPHSKPSKKAPHQEKDPVQAKQEKQQRKDLGLSKSAAESALDSLIQMDEDPFAGQEEMLANIHENSEGLVERQVVKGGKGTKKSGLDEVLDFVKSDEFVSPKQTEADRAKIAAIGNPKKAKKSFVKAEGVGGMVFDFGHLTGNAIADNATALINRHGDPVQSGNASYQKKSYDDALVNFAQKGEAHTRETSMFGNIDKGWSNQLNKPMDQQVKEMYENEKIANDPETPAVRNQFNNTTLNVGGDVIKATSETDAAVLEMMRSQMEATTEDGGVVADASAGGAQRVEITL
jgi:hypothetical protein